MPARKPAGSAAARIDVQRLVKFTGIDGWEPGRWEVATGSGRWRGRIGTQLGILEIRNARSAAVVLDFGDAGVACFHPQDLFPVRYNTELAAGLAAKEKTDAK